MLLAVFLSVAALFGPSGAQAVGQKCCSQSLMIPIGIICNRVVPPPTVIGQECKSDEECYHSQNICVKKGMKISGDCCDAGSTYDPTGALVNKPCIKPDGSEGNYLCRAGEVCSVTLGRKCVVGAANNPDLSTGGSKSPCMALKDSELTNCLSCLNDVKHGGANKGGYAYTALGCLPVTPGPLAGTILKIGIMLGGSAAVLFIIYGGATLMFSAGDPQKVQQGREVIISAVSGLMLILFSLVILRVIGVDILGIPEF